MSYMCFYYINSLIYILFCINRGLNADVYDNDEMLVGIFIIIIMNISVLGSMVWGGEPRTDGLDPSTGEIKI